MRIYEENLKKIINEISKYGIVTNIEIENSSISVTPPTKKGKKTKLIEIDIKRANKFKISLVMGI